MQLPGLLKNHEAARKALFHLTLIVFALCCVPLRTAAQSSDSTIAPNRGFHPSASYAMGNIETVNTTNGNLMMNIPLASLPPGRGGHPGFTLQLSYNSKIWDGQPDVVPDPNNPNQNVDVTWLQASDRGGWRYNTQGYSWWVYNRNQGGVYYQAPDCRHFNIWMMKVSFPDGSEREFRPYGIDDQCDDNYFTVQPAPGMSYYSTDGSFARLDIGQNGEWTISFGDGSRVVHTAANQRVYDRNGNYNEMYGVSNYNNTGHSASIIADQLGRTIAIEYGTNEHYIHVAGVNGETVTTTVKWGSTYVNKVYRAANHGQYPVNIEDWEMTGVSEIILPSQLGTNLKYLFEYNGWPTSGNSSPSVGWGELSSVTLPTGARADYQYDKDNVSSPFIPANWILKNSPKRKDLNYNLEYDGSTTAAPTETWLYSITDTLGTITAPDGGITRENFGDIDLPSGGQVYKTENPDGSVVERIWKENIPYLPPGVTIHASVKVNDYVGMEVVSIRDAGDTLARTAIKDYRYDKNGNLIQVFEYDWVPYSSVARDGSGNPTGAIPAEAQLKRVNTGTYYCVTPDASNSTTNDPDSYDRASAPLHRSAVAASETGDGGQTLARSEFFYDNAFTTGNLTQQTTWDSTKGVYSSPLSAGNSISIYHQYDAYGNRTLATDGRGFQTKFIYGAISGASDLYPTTVISAFGTSIQRTVSQTYDFHTGLVKAATDVDNNVINETDYDGLGRPTESRAAANVPGVKTVVRTEYSAVNRRVITRSDLNIAYDGKLVSVQHYDQIGRVRLARQLEDSTTQDVYDETTGIKAQTRYAFSGLHSYTLTSNPYRAATSGGATGEATMGWTRSKSDNGGRILEVQTFGGALPSPWGGNATSSGTISTTYDANQTTVTDQAGKARKSVTDAFGRLIEIYEDPASLNYLTSYSYDTLDNLITVNQGTQTRTFVHDSLKRLTSSTNPESGTISYQYDANGNLTQKIDARSITTAFVYDALNRVTTRDYSDSNPDVSYVYDSVGVSHSKGRLTSVSSSVSSYSYSGFDAIGRVTGATQSIGAQSYPITNITYDLAGHLKTMTYPSGRTITNTFDGAGRLSSFTGNLGDGGTQRTYSTGISYSSFGGMKWEQYGTTTPLYHKTFYNTRGQMFDTRVSSVNDTWDWNRGRLILYYSSNHQWGASGTDNNGNVMFMEHWIPPPNATLDQAQYLIEDSYTYDSLNRISAVSEQTLDIGGGGSWTPRFAQAYSYDRYGNRTINAGATWGTGINNKQFTVDTNNNRLGVPGGQSGAMSYDNAGNLSTDTYSGSAVTRVYNAENKMTSETTYNSVVAGSYSYDGDGRRVKRVVGAIETWQVYGIGGELIAEYAANGASSSPQKEYGYRNGELLITATVTTGWGAPPTLNDNPLQVGVTTVQARHITELRDAINSLRSHMSMSAYSWQYSATTSDYVNANPILEMRTALDQALGAPGGGYAAGLAQGQPVKAIHIQELRDRVLGAWVSGGGVDIRWLVTDQLGTPRMIFDQTGSLANVSRHDYLPFGEEVPANFRTGIAGYGTGDNVRPKFTQKERDNETGLDYFGARYYGSTQGRFTAADNPGFSHGTDPQTWNLYAYTANNPLRRVDPDGRDWFQIGDGYGAKFVWQEGKEYKYKDHTGKEHKAKNVGTHLVVFEITGSNSDDAIVGTLTLYEQNKVVAQNTNAFSGGDDSWLPTGNYNTIPPGVYTIQTDKRSVARNWDDMEGVYGLQEVQFKAGQEQWGTRRARLNEWQEGLPDAYRGNFIHGRQKPGDYTASCICDRQQTVVDALFKINFRVTPRVKAVVTDGPPKPGAWYPGPYVIKPSP